jgi:hypothetical protein
MTEREQPPINGGEQEKDLTAILKQISEKRARELEKLLEESPVLREKVEKVLAKTVDIEQYNGLIQHSHPGNLEEIFKYGLGNPEAKVKYVESRQSVLARDERGHYNIDGLKIPLWLTTYGDNDSFKKWQVPWYETLRKYPLVLLIDSKQISEIAKYVHTGLYLEPTESKPGSFRDVKEPTKTSKSSIKPPYTFRKPHGEALRKLEREVEGIGYHIRDRWGHYGNKHISLEKDNNEVLPLNQAIKLIETIKNENREYKEIEITPSHETRKALSNSINGIVLSPVTVEQQIRERVQFSPEQMADVTLNRMNRVTQREESIVAPVYDNQGNMLWPKYMTYEEVKHFVADREQEENK